MSITVSYFFNSALAIPDLAAQVAAWLGVTMRRDDETGDFDARILAMNLQLEAHRYENDRDVDFATYRFALTLRTSVGAGDIRPIQVETAAQIAYVLFRRLDVTEGLLVFDLQMLLARYLAKRDNSVEDLKWFDVVSGTPVKFPEHFLMLQQRIGRFDWRLPHLP